MKYRISEDVLFQVVDGEVVLLELEEGAYFGLNEVGSRVWQLIEAGAGLDHMLATLEAEFDVTEDVLRADVEGLLDELQAAKLIVPEADATA